MEYIQIGKLKVSRLILGGNPFSGFSHQGVEMDNQMRRYYTCRRIKDTFAEAERLGINTFIGRTDNHIMRVLFEYWDEGGRIQWFAQMAPEYASAETSVKMAKEGGAKACHIHGGIMDHLLAHNKGDEVQQIIGMLRDAGLAAAVAGHKPQVFQWAEENLDVDYYLCSYYNPMARDNCPQHIPGLDERFDPADREAMVGVIQGLSKPVIHYKIMAAGRNRPADSFRYAAKHIRPCDAVCVGVYTRDLPKMLEEDVRLLEESLSGH